MSSKKGVNKNSIKNILMSKKTNHKKKPMESDEFVILAGNRKDTVVIGDVSPNIILSTREPFCITTHPEVTESMDLAKMAQKGQLKFLNTKEAAKHREDIQKEQKELPTANGISKSLIKSSYLDALKVNIPIPNESNLLPEDTWKDSLLNRANPNNMPAVLNKPQNEEIPTNNLENKIKDLFNALADIFIILSKEKSVSQKQ